MKKPAPRTVSATRAAKRKPAPTSPPPAPPRTPPPSNAPSLAQASPREAAALARAFETLAPKAHTAFEKLRAAADRLAQAGIAATEPLRAAAAQAAAQVEELQKKTPGLSTEAAILVALAPSAPPSAVSNKPPADRPAFLSPSPAAGLLRADCLEWEERTTALEDYADILAFSVECETFTADQLRAPETTDFRDYLRDISTRPNLFRRGGLPLFQMEIESDCYGLDTRPGLFSAGLIARPFAWPGWRWNQHGLTMPADFDLAAELRRLRTGAGELRRLEREESPEWKDCAEAAEDYRDIKAAILRRYASALEEIRTLRKKIRRFCTSRQVEAETVRAAAALANRFPGELPSEPAKPAEPPTAEPSAVSPAAPDAGEPPPAPRRESYTLDEKNLARALAERVPRIPRKNKRELAAALDAFQAENGNLPGVRDFVPKWKRDTARFLRLYDSARRLATELPRKYRAPLLPD